MSLGYPKLFYLNMSHYYDREVKVSSAPQTFNLEFKNEKFIFQTDNGVFSKKYIDFGTYVLLKNYVSNDIDGPILDMCCGYGPVGVILGKLTTKEIYMTEINERAYELAKKNLEINNVSAKIYCGDLYESLPNINFSEIIVNPPIRAGKKTVFAIYDGALERLVPNGSLWVVIQKKQGADSTKKYLTDLFTKVEVISKEKGYQIIRCIK